jgi:hypothetical protein
MLKAVHNYSASLRSEDEVRNEDDRLELIDRRKDEAALEIPELARLATRRGASNSVPSTPTPPMAMACPIGCNGVTMRIAPGHHRSEVVEEREQGHDVSNKMREKAQQPMANI